MFLQDLGFLKLPTTNFSTYGSALSLSRTHARTHTHIHTVILSLFNFKPLAHFFTYTSESAVGQAPPGEFSWISIVKTGLTTIYAVPKGYGIIHSTVVHLQHQQAAPYH